MTESNFNDCIDLLRQGDMQGLKIIYEEYGKMIYSAALQICRNTQTAEDVTSEFFLKLKKAAAVYRKNFGHKKWLIVSARNLAIDFMRKESRVVPMSVQGGDEESHPLSEIPDSTDTEEQIASEESVRQLLDSLNDSQREVIHLKIYCGLTFAEIADVLHIPQGTVSWRYQSAVKKLRKLCKEVQI